MVSAPGGRYTVAGAKSIGNAREAIARRISSMTPRLLIGRHALEEGADLWRSLEASAHVPPFQRLAWARAWLDHLGGAVTPWLVAVEGARPALWPLFVHRRGGLRRVGLIGEGVSDYLGPIGDAGASLHAVTDLLLRRAPRFDVLDLRGVALPDEARKTLLEELGPRARERLYERCPVVDTRGSWESYLGTRKKKFRANLKRALRRVSEQGEPAVARERASEPLLGELEAVERESWKWANGTAYFKVGPRRAFLRHVLADPEIASEIWTCRVAGELAAFAVVFPSGQTRLYYLPSFSARFSDAGSYLLGEIIRESCESPFQEVDLLQGDEGYKMAWATSERAVYEVSAPGSSAVAPAAAAALAARWRLARSARARQLHARLVAWRGRLAR